MKHIIILIALMVAFTTFSSAYDRDDHRGRRDRDSYAGTSWQDRAQRAYDDDPRTPYMGGAIRSRAPGGDGLYRRYFGGDNDE